MMKAAPPFRATARAARVAEARLVAPMSTMAATAISRSPEAGASRSEVELLRYLTCIIPAAAVGLLGKNTKYDKRLRRRGRVSQDD